MSLSKLNHDCQLAIFSSLPFNGQLRLRLVSTYWCDQLSILLTKRTTVAFCHSLSPLMSSSQLLGISPSTRKHLLSIAHPSPEQINLLGTLCPAIRTLLYLAVLVDNPTLVCLLRQWPGITGIAIKFNDDFGRNQPDLWETLQLASKLKHLSTNYLTFSQFSHVTISRLVSLQLKGIQCEQFAHLPLHLKHLTIERLNVSGDISRIFTQMRPQVCPSLTHLSIRRVSIELIDRTRQNTVAQLITQLGNRFPSVQSLELQTEEHIVGQNLPPFARCTTELSRFSHLSNLRLPTSLLLESLLPFWIRHPCTVLPSITILHLYRFDTNVRLFDSITGESLANRLSTVFPGLKRLILHLPELAPSREFFADKVAPNLNNVNFTFVDI